MTPKFAIRVNEIRAALLFASNDESRYVLNGVHFVKAKRREPICVATDGRRLCVIETEALQDEDDDSGPTSFTVSTAILKPVCALAKSFGKILGQELVFTFHRSERLVIEFRGVDCVIDYEKRAVIEGDYPKWRQVLPAGEKSPIPVLGLNANYIGDFSKVAKVLGVDPMIRCNIFKQDSAIEVLVQGKENFYAVVMPTKPEEPDNWQPSFVGFEPPAPEPKESKPVSVKAQ